MPALQISSFFQEAAKDKFAPGYLLAGSELYFRDRIREALVKFFLQGRRDEIVEHELAETPVRDALDDAATLGLFAGRRVVWLRSAESLLARRRAAGDDEDDEAPQTAGRHSAEAIAAYFERPQPASVVVFEATSLDL